jgi:putative membrane protein
VALPLAVAFVSFQASELSLPPVSYPAAALLLAGVALLGWLRYRDAGWSYSGGCLVLRSRSVARTTALAPRRKLQSRSFVSNPLQRRARLAHLQVKVASGSGGAEFGLQDLESRDVRELISRLGPVRPGTR